MSDLPVLSVSDFVAIFNQTINYAFPTVTVEGELTSLRINRNTWVYFNLKDEMSSVKFFGSTSRLPGPLSDGMKLRVSGVPQLHPQFGFSISVQDIQLAGEGTIVKAAKLLESKLEKEGLFDVSRKRAILYPPRKIGLVTSSESAAYSDFIKVINARWSGVVLYVADVLVQGERAADQIVSAIKNFNESLDALDAITIIRGGGSADDLQAFNDERVVRAVAASRIPTLVAIGHERDISLAEKAADKRASTPSNAAELLVPDRNDSLIQLNQANHLLTSQLKDIFSRQQDDLEHHKGRVSQLLTDIMTSEEQKINLRGQILGSTNPTNVLKRGYSIVRKNGKAVKSSKKIIDNDHINIEFADGSINTRVNVE